jgi:DUF971 family protein
MKNRKWSLCRYDKIGVVFISIDIDFVVFVWQTPSGQNVSVAAVALRRACKCARCVDEMSGEQLLRPDSVKSDIKPVNMKRRGNYAVAIDWSDGHTSSIYPYAQIVTLAAAGTSL